MRRRVIARTIVRVRARDHCEVAHRQFAGERGREMFPPVAKVRLDTLLAERGLFATRSRAAASVLAGEVRLGSERRRADKPGQLVAEDVVVAVAEAPAFVSRGGRKLANALDATGIDPAGRRCLDVGASTGGFTDCLLQRGRRARRRARRRLRRAALAPAQRRPRDRARALQRARARARRAALRARPHRDRRVVHLAGQGAARGARLRGDRFDCLALCKPQFEVGRERVGKGGVVRTPDDRREALLVAVAARGRAPRRRGARLRLVGPARAQGQPRDLRVAGRAGPRGRLEDVEAAAREVEP